MSWHTIPGTNRQYDHDKLVQVLREGPRRRPRFCYDGKTTGMAGICMSQTCCNSRLIPDRILAEAMLEAMVD